MAGHSTEGKAQAPLSLPINVHDRQMNISYRHLLRSKGTAQGLLAAVCTELDEEQDALPARHPPFTKIAYSIGRREKKLAQALT